MRTYRFIPNNIGKYSIRGTIMSFEITPAQLEELIGTNPYLDQWHSAICEICPKYSIDTTQRLAAFLAQCAHESNGFKSLKENLNYSAQGLANTWPNRFAVKDADGKAIKPYTPDVTATRIERNPDVIANNVYANRLGNGPVESGDGARYCGRGLIQLTGKDNYTRFADSIGKPFEEIVAYLETPAGALESACWFWTTNNLNQYADSDDIETLTKRINGGLIGLDDRKTRYSQALQVLGA